VVLDLTAQLRRARGRIGPVAQLLLGCCDVDAALVDGAVVGGAVVGGWVDGTVDAAVDGTVAFEGGAVLGTVAIVVGGVDASSSSNTNTTSTTTATTMIALTTITATRCQPSHVESRSSSSDRRGGVVPSPPARVRAAYVRVGSTGSDGYAIGRSSGAMTLAILRGPSRQTDRVRLAPARVVWLALPLTSGPAASDALSTWPSAPRVLGAAFLWLAWGAGLVALLAPRPVGLTVVRVVAPAFAALAIVAAAWGDASTTVALFAVVGTLAASALVADPAVAIASANGIAYGDERRFPLRTPPALYLAPLPLARAVAAAGPVTGPLLLADGQVLWGLVALAVGIPATALAARSLQVLARRWLVLVPAGLVVADPMTLADPVLVVRRRLRALAAVPATRPPDEGTIDLRLGATFGTLLVGLDGTIDIVRSASGRRPDETLRPSALLVAIAGRGELLEAATRRATAQAATMPPPSSASPS